VNQPWVTIGGLLLLLFIFAVPAVLIPSVMEDVPDRSMTKLFVVHQEAENIVDRTFAKHRTNDHPSRLMPLPEDARSWIELINPMVRKAPGGGPAILSEANSETGALGLKGNSDWGRLTIPAYRSLTQQETLHGAVEQ
jgi:hypothetical protein